jgi:hypothetical protein
MLSLPKSSSLQYADGPSHRTAVAVKGNSINAYGLLLCLWCLSKASRIAAEDAPYEVLISGWSDPKRHNATTANPNNIEDAAGI